MSKANNRNERPGDAFGRQIPPGPGPATWNVVEHEDTDEPGEWVLCFPDSKLDVSETWLIVRTDLLVDTEENA